MNEDDSKKHDMSPDSEATNHDAKVPLPAWLTRQPPPQAACIMCNSRHVSYLPTFALGSGIALRPFADDVLCRRCGHVAPPIWRD